MSAREFHNDLDEIRQIVFDIAQPLRHGQSTDVNKGTIENAYSVLDASEGEVGGTVHEKCAAIIDVLRDQYSVDAEYSIMDGTIHFVPCRPW